MSRNPGSSAPTSRWLSAWQWRSGSWTESFGEDRYTEDRAVTFAGDDQESECEKPVGGDDGEEDCGHAK